MFVKRGVQMKKFIVSTIILFNVILLSISVNAQEATEAGKLESKQEAIDRKVAEFSKQRQMMAEFQALSLEHTQLIQERYKIFQEKLKLAQTPEDKYRLQLEFQAEQQESKGKFQEKVKAFYEQANPAKRGKGAKEEKKQMKAE